MFTISSDSLLGSISIFDSFNSINQPNFNKIGDTYTLSFINLKKVKSFNKFTFTTSGSNEWRYLTTQYRISKDSIKWSSWYNLKQEIENFPPLDPKSLLFIDIKWTRTGDSSTGVISLLSYNLSGSIQRNISQNGGSSETFI